MSLYIFGKLIPCATFDSSRFAKEHPLLRLDGVDPDDVSALDEQASLAGEGFYFAITSSRDSVDSTLLWNEALSVAAGKGSAADSVLGGELCRLLTDSQLNAGGIAFVDGGVETILEGSPGQCWEWFEIRIRKPWDAIDNPLLIWMPDRSRTNERLRQMQS